MLDGAPKVFLLLALAATLAACGSKHGPGDSDGSVADGASLPDGPAAPDGPAEAPLDPWTVFSLAGADTPMEPSALPGGDFEGAAGFSAWSAYQKGYLAAPGEGRAGGAALKLVRLPADTTASGAYQTVTLAQSAPKPIYFSGWAKADTVTGDPDHDFAIYLDIRYVRQTEDPVHGCVVTAEEPCSLYGQSTTPAFDTGTHDWQFRDGFAVPAYPIKEVAFYVLFRGAHDGTAWFDDLSLSAVTADVLSFDGRLVAGQQPAAPYTAGSAVDLASQDGLALSLWSRGGALRSAAIDGVEVFDPAYDWASGLIVHEAGAKDFVAPGGVVTLEAGVVEHRATIPALSLETRVSYVAEGDRIRARIEATDTSGQDRAITVYWALPAAFSATSTSWGDDPRRLRAASGAAELSSTTAFWFDQLGATGTFSRYPFGTIFDATSGLALGYAVDQPRVARIAYQPHTHQLYLALDVGLTAAAAESPGVAATEIVLYRTRHAHESDGFRSALGGFQARFPAHFARRIPPEREGIWNAFDDLSTLQHGPGESIDDFHFGIHESSTSYATFDDQHAILTFRYLTEPGSTWLQIPDAAGVDPTSYDQVLAYLQSLYASGTASQKLMAEKTLSSGIFDADQRYHYQGFASGPPWCPGKCALFYLSPLPGIAAPPYTVDQASYSWNDDAKQVYVTTPGLDGDYLDSFTMEATRLNYRRAHLAAAQVPPTFAYEAPYPVGMPVVFSTVEFARWVKSELPAGKYFIANGGILGIPFGADLFDFTGQETDWLHDAGGGVYELVPQSDSQLIYYRAMSGQRPYGFLMNTDFTNFSNAMVERYMRICLFYGIYPSMFSANASTNTYFSTPALYNRDRPLFKIYVPLIQALSAAGWEPLTGAWSSDAGVYLERWGAWPGPLYLTLRNTTDAAAAVTITLDREALGLAASSATVRSWLLGAAAAPLAGEDTTVSVALPAQEVEMLELLP
jgi:hypothetical protein